MMLHFYVNILGKKKHFFLIHKKCTYVNFKKKEVLRSLSNLYLCISDTKFTARKAEMEKHSRTKIHGTSFL